MKKEHEYVRCYLTQSVKTIEKRNKGQSKEDKKRAFVCMFVAWELFFKPPRMSDKQIKILITRKYLHLLWRTYYRKRRKSSGARRETLIRSA